LGKLCFHTSYGQNLLAHSVEVSLLAGAMAEELELDAGLARRAGLLHDIAKAVDHVIGGDETQTSASLARKDGESPEVVEVIETHSLELPTRSAVAVLVRAADEISTSRPGAHKERVEDYIRRMQQIEEIAGSHPGVTKAYSLQTGKEVRVLVDSATVDDAYADQLADEITEMLEDELAQPGQIKVCLIREVRAVHYAR
jgi:ribonuclease Y